MNMETGTLKELNIQPGDVVECVESTRHWWTVGNHYIVTKNDCILDDDGDPWCADEASTAKFRIISRATEAKADTPKLWRDMTPEEKGALLLAAHEGKVIEVWNWRLKVWYEVNPPKWLGDIAYRVKPEPKRETFTLWIYPDGEKSVNVGTIDMIDGKPDFSSINMGQDT